MDREAMDGEAMITDTREGAGARADESTLVELYNRCLYAARARDADGATRRDSSGHGTERWLCVPPATLWTCGSTCL